MSSWLRRSLNSFATCIAPDLCYGCGAALNQDGQFACVTCSPELPYTDFHHLKENPFIDKFFGRIPIHAAGAFLYFSKSGIARSIIHDLKYKSRPEVGTTIGLHYGYHLLESPLFQDIDMIIPVPLHKNRFAFRGYNQSDSFGEGLAASMSIPLRTDIIVRHRETRTQTKKSRVERFANVDGAFRIEKPMELYRKHILLVDDVLTSGATLEGCAKEFAALPNTTISMATIGFAHYR